MGAEATVQRKTMLIWFLANYEVARGTIFGFGEAQPEPARHDGTFKHDGSVTYGGQPITYEGKTLAYEQNPDLRIGGFDEGVFFDGGWSPELLGKEFGDGVGSERIEEVAAALPGLWMLRTDDLASAAPYNAEELVRPLDGLAEAIRQLPNRVVDRLDNHPPEAIEDGDLAVLTVAEKASTLGALSNVRRAVLSGAYSLAVKTFEAIKPVFTHFGTLLHGSAGRVV